MSEPITKFTSTQHDILQELSKTFARLGAETGIFAALHSWGDTLPDSEVLQMLRDMQPA